MILEILCSKTGELSLCFVLCTMSEDKKMYEDHKTKNVSQDRKGYKVSHFYTRLLQT